MTTAIEVHNQPTTTATTARYDGLSMVVPPAEAMRRLQELQAFVSTVMVRDSDYGVIPGTDKPTLLQPGAQKLAEIYGFAIDFVDAGSIEDWEKGFFLYRKRCVLTSRRDGRFICAGVGSCNSKEDRYAGRWVFESDVPAGLDKNNLRSKSFRSKAGKPFTKYRVPNEDIFSLVNTIEKMACKRSLVGAVISATRSAGIFTQDVEDLPAEAFGKADDRRSWEAEKTVAGPAAPADAEFEPVAGDQEPYLVMGLLDAIDAVTSREQFDAVRKTANEDRSKMSAAQRAKVAEAIKMAAKRIEQEAAA